MNYQDKELKMVPLSKLVSISPIDKAKAEMQAQIEFWQTRVDDLEAAEQMTGQAQIDFLLAEFGQHTDSLGRIDSPRIVLSPVFDLEDSLERQE